MGDIVDLRRPRRRAPLVPFTVPHFKEYASRLVFDDGEQRPPEAWQLDFVREVFRGVREAWLVVPEENGKTTLVAQLALYGCDWAQRPWIPVGASSRDQARVLYTQAKGFVSDTPGLERRFRWMDGYREIRSRRNGGRGIVICPWDPSTNDGTIPYPYAIVDELHRHPDLSLYRLWRGKLRKRGAQIIAISTAGEPGGEFEETRDRIRRDCEQRWRRHGGTRYRGQGLAMWEYMLKDPELALDPRAVAKINPLSTITAEKLADDLKSPTFDIGDWRRLKCNLPTRSVQAAITDDEWGRARVDGRIPARASVDLGLDVAFKWDTTAAVPLWKGVYRLLGPAKILTPPRDGSSMHPDTIKDALLGLAADYRVETVVMDMSRAEDIASWIEDELGVTVIDRDQGNKAACADYEAFMDGLRNGTLRHTGDQGLRRHVLNAIARRLPGGDHRFDRPSTVRQNVKAQDRRVIDALTAAAMVVEHSVRAKPRRSIYEERFGT